MLIMICNLTKVEKLILLDLLNSVNSFLSIWVQQFSYMNHKQRQNLNLKKSENDIQLINDAKQIDDANSILDALLQSPVAST